MTKWVFVTVTFTGLLPMTRTAPLASALRARTRGAGPVALGTVSRGTGAAGARSAAERTREGYMSASLQIRMFGSRDQDTPPRARGKGAESPRYKLDKNLR